MSPQNIFHKKSRWILDGGLASELVKKGFDLKHPLWSAKVLYDDSRAIYDVHRSYLAAGADIILTSSYQASVPGFMKHLGMYRQEANETLYFTVEMACRARADHLEATASGLATDVLIGASVGPYGAILADGSEYRGDYDLNTPAVSEYYEDKIETLILPRRHIRADFLAFETIPTAREAELITMILKDIPWARAWISFSRPEECLRALTVLNDNEQIAAIGLNCVAPETIDQFLPQLAAQSVKPIVVYPNRGSVYDVAEKKWLPAPQGHHQVWRERAQRWYQSGARIVGGCCQVEPADITEIFHASKV